MFLALVKKDLLRRWRSPASSIVMLLFPFMMAGMIGTVSSGPNTELPETKILVLDREGGILGGFLGGGTPDDSPVVVEAELVGEEGFERMENGDASAMVVIPENFTSDLLDGRDVTLQVVRNPTESIKPELIEQGMQVIATYIDVAVKALGEELDQVADMLDAETTPSLVTITTLTGEVYAKMTRAEQYLFPPVVRVTSTKEEGTPPPNLFGYVLVMVSVMSVLFVAIRAVTDLYEDQRTGMLRRQLATPMPIGSLVAAKILFAVLFSMAVMVILLLSGALFGWFRQSVPLPSLVLHTIAFALSAAGLMVLLVSLVRTEKQAGIVAWIVVMLMSVVGGSMFPAEMLPGPMQDLARFTLNYWAIEGYLDLVVRGGALDEVLRSTALLGGLGVVFTVLGQALMRRRLREVVR